MTRFKVVPLNKYWIALLVAGLLSTLLVACDRPIEHDIPQLEKESKAYLELLETGDKTRISDVFFMPLRKKDISHLIKTFEKECKAVQSGDLKVSITATHQQGRWGIVTLNKISKISSKEQHEHLWFFYYKQKWRVISPEIYHTKEVRAMMNLYPEYEVLKRWLRNTKEPT